MIISPSLTRITVIGDTNAEADTVDVCASAINCHFSFRIAVSLPFSLHPLPADTEKERFVSCLLRLSRGSAAINKLQSEPGLISFC